MDVFDNITSIIIKFKYQLFTDELYVICNTCLYLAASKCQIHNEEQGGKEMTMNQKVSLMSV